MTDNHVFQAVIISTLCGVCFWAGMDHQYTQDKAKLKSYEEQIKYNKLLLSQPCMREGAIKKLVFDMRRRYK